VARAPPKSRARYTDGRASPGGATYKIADGECTIFDQYLRAIAAARQSIYIENQTIPIPPIAAALEVALRRGVEVVISVPARPKEYAGAACRNPERRLLFDQAAKLDMYRRFALIGIAALNAQGQRRDIYVRAKVMLVDDVWATIGSCNLHSNSLSGHTEMNALIWDAAVVRPLRFRATGRTPRPAYSASRCAGSPPDANDPVWQGIACRLDAATYGE